MLKSSIYSSRCARVDTASLGSRPSPPDRTRLTKGDDKMVTGCLEVTIIQILLGKSFPIFLPKNWSLRGIQTSEPNLVGSLNWQQRSIYTVRYARFSSVDHTSDVVAGSLVWRTLYWSYTREQVIEENEVNTLYIFYYSPLCRYSHTLRYTSKYDAR